MQIVLLVLYLGASLGTAYRNTEFASRHDCYIHQGFTSPYITAFQHSMATLEGCSTNQTSLISSKEVHILSIDGRSRRDGGHSSNRISTHHNRRNHALTLHVASRGDAEHSGSVVVVLWSAQPTIWSITFEKISNSSRYLFVLPKMSRMRTNENLAIHIKVKKFNSTTVPSGLDNLMTWTKEKYGIITSANRLPHSDNLSLLVGVDPLASSECHLSASLPDSTFHGQAVTWHKENASSCAAKWNEGYKGKDVHIIEVHETPETCIPGGKRADILLVITANKMPPPVKQVDLVLKSPPDASWTIDISKFKGNLRIITNAEDVPYKGSVRQTVSITSETLVESGQSLMNWVADSYGHPVSYTDVAIADKFILYVDGGDKLPYTISGSNYRPVVRPTQPPHGGATHNYIVEQTKTVSCSDTSMDVVLPKLMLRDQGIGWEHLSLQDHLCRARDNKTHLILSTKYDQCGTKYTTENNMAVYTNLIIIRTSPSNNAKGWRSGNVAAQTAAVSDEIDGSGSGFDDIMNDDTFIDDEDLHGDSSHNSGVHVSCKIPLHKTSAPPFRRTFVPKYEIGLYLDNEYSRVLSKESMPRFSQGDFVYVQATVITTVPELRPMIKSCVVSPGNVPSDKSHKLIDKGCILDSNNLFEVDEGPLGEQRFKLRVLDYWQDEMGSMFYIICDLAMCTESEQHSSIPMCVNQAQYCFINNMGEDINDPAVQAKTKQVVSAAMLVVNPLRPPGQPNVPKDTPIAGPPYIDGASSVPTAAVISNSGRNDEKCERIVRVEGLDSGTVVGIAFAAFIIGVLLTAALWYIHTHTGPLGRRNSRPRSAETSGESTPSSTAPITIHQVHRFNPPMAVHDSLLWQHANTAPTTVYNLILSPMLDKFHHLE